MSRLQTPLGSSPHSPISSPLCVLLGLAPCVLPLTSAPIFALPLPHLHADLYHLHLPYHIVFRWVSLSPTPSPSSLPDLTAMASPQLPVSPCCFLAQAQPLSCSHNPTSLSVLPLWVPHRNVLLQPDGLSRPGQGVVRRRRWHPTPVLLPGKSHGRALFRCARPSGVPRGPAASTGPHPRGSSRISS